MIETLISLLITATFIGVCSLAAFGASRGLTRRSETRRALLSMAAGGAVPTVVILLLLGIGHVIWWRQGHQGYSPLAITIYGFPILVLNLVLNVAAARLATLPR